MIERRREAMLPVFTLLSFKADGESLTTGLLFPWNEDGTEK
jgi:hypothetical protein